MRVQEAAPRLPVALRCWRQPSPAEDVADGGCRNGYVELSQLTHDPQVAPSSGSRARGARSAPAPLPRSAAVPAVGADTSSAEPSAGCHRSSVSGRTKNAFHERRGNIRLNAASNTRSCASNRGWPACRRRIDSSWRSTRISSSFARSPRPTSTINSNRRQTTMYRADTSKGGLQQTGTARRHRRLKRPSRLTRSGFCTPLVGEEAKALTLP
jgi:hypothetical protein